MSQTQLPIKQQLPASYRGTYDSRNPDAFKVSRSKIDLFSECQRCAYLDMKLGVKRPQGPSFTLNNAVDELFKREFDVHRAKGEPHPLMQAYKIDAVPYVHGELETWRDALHHGIMFHHEPTNLLIGGGIDDVWVDPKGQLIIVDYKATAKKKGPSTQDDLYDSYKRQMEIYQWLFEQNGFKVAPTGYFVYANGRSDAKAFDGRLEFDVVLIPYKGDNTWVEPAIVELKRILESEAMPPVGKGFWGDPCDYCGYAQQRTKLTLGAMKNSKEENNG